MLCDNRPVEGAKEGSSNVARSVVLIALAIAALGALFFARDSGDPTAGGAASSTSGAARDASAVVVIEDPKPTLDEEAIGGISFLDVTAEAGLDQAHSDEQVDSAPGMTSGAAAADVDGDGDIDLYLTRIGKPNALYLNTGKGTFRDGTEEAGVGGAPTQGSTVGSFADVDADGDLDLYVAGAGTTPDTLYVNDGSGHFHDEAAARGLALPPLVVAETGANVHGVTFADPDHDGDLDLLVTQWDTALLTAAPAPARGSAKSVCAAADALRAKGFPRAPGSEPNRARMYRNDGTGHFADVTSEVGLRLDQIIAFTPQFVDVDGDGWEDLLMTGDGCTSRLYRNVGGTRFEDVTAAAGVGTDENGMGSVVRDIDGDGRPDWFVTSIAYPTEGGTCPARALFTGCSGNRVYRNDGGMRFTDVTDELGLRNGWWGWGAAIEDFGNDGRLQVAQTNGYRESFSIPDDGTDPQRTYFDRFVDDPMRFWITGPDGAYVDAASQVGLDDTGVGHALVPFDYDGDGRLDLLVADTSAPPRLYRNESPDDRGWLRVRLDDPTRPGNREGLGARVAVTPRKGATPVVGWIDTAGSYETRRPADLHVGLGEDAGPVARVEVWWPGEPEPQVIEDVEPDQTLVVTRTG